MSIFVVVRTKIKVTVIRLHIDCNCWLVRWRSYAIAECDCMQVVLCIFLFQTFFFQSIVRHLFFFFHFLYHSFPLLQFHSVSTWIQNHQFFIYISLPFSQTWIWSLFSRSFCSNGVWFAFCVCFSFIRFILILISHRKSHSNIILYHHDIIFYLFFAMLLERLLLLFQPFYRPLCLFLTLISPLCTSCHAQRTDSLSPPCRISFRIWCEPTRTFRFNFLDIWERET